ncbi:hypothetical protein JB92DRAFT_2724834 [Gautieria morchelliformis]|nr:hypothetical protein JB92DRAFT_2724834 [Gautieria morchelliformis]
MLQHRAKHHRRHLVLRHAEAVARYHRGLAPLRTVDDGGVVLYPGEVVLFSVYRPSLRAGQYRVDVKQDIATPEVMNLGSTQDLRVIGPRFAFEKGDVVSSYPPQGHGDYSFILPHVVLDDPHMPWVRLGTLDKSPKPDDGRNSVPWLALLVFTQDELEVDDTFLNVNSKKLEQTASMAVEMTLADVWALQDAGKVVTPYGKSDPETIQPETETSFVFLRPEEFTSLFRSYDTNGTQVTDQAKPDTSRYRYLSHVRGINTEGLPDAEPVSQRLYSVVISHRTPPANVTKPTPVAVHLVSIENVENVLSWPPPVDKRIGLVSLHSWTYSCLPPDAMSLQERLRYLGDTMGPLRVPDSVINSIGGTDINNPAIIQRLKDRATDGFTLVRYRLQTGEDTLAFTRSPFTPADTQFPLPNFPQISFSSTDLQVLDTGLGIMDLTYSTAWQLGKTLAIADRAFSAAVVRLRSTIYREGLAGMKLEFMRANARGGFPNKAETLRALPGLIKSISKLHETRVFTTVGTEPEVSNLTKRWSRLRKFDVDLSTRNVALAETFGKHCGNSAARLSAAADGIGFYNELNAPSSTDWMLILKWLTQSMFLYDVPMHYFIPDSAILPEESLRFFFIDKNWITMLVDGALSVGNHFSMDADSIIRGKIKQQLSEYLDTTDPDTHYKPQIPTHGFLLRSKVVQLFPALTVRAPRTDPNDLRAPILRQEILSDGTMLCLFDREPGSADFRTLTIQLPPHQQRFTIADEYTEDHIRIVFKKVYTSGAPEDSYGALGEAVWRATEETKAPIFDWESRTLIFPTWADTVFTTIKDGMEAGKFTDDMPTAALIGIQQNDPLYEMSIISPNTSYSTIRMAFGTQGRLLYRDVPEATVSASIPRAVTPVHAAQQIARYEYGLWPIDDIGGDYIPTNLGYPIDLVFKVVRTDNSNPTSMLQKIRVELPTDDAIAITDRYEGPGGKMVSNCRWNFSVAENRENLIIIEVIPRSLSGESSVGDNDEISFILKQVTVRPRPGETRWHITFVEVYGPEPNPGGWVSYTLRERPEA